MAELGFEINNKFFPLVRFDDWLMSDFVLARKLTGVSTDELLSRSADSMLLQQTLVAVAVAHQRRELNMEQVVDFIYGLKPTDVKELGFDFVEEGEAGPPAEGAEEVPTVSSESSGSSTDALPETGSPDASGTHGSDTGQD